jgi:hypothetical protein
LAATGSVEISRFQTFEDGKTEQAAPVLGVLAAVGSGVGAGVGACGGIRGRAGAAVDAGLAVVAGVDPMLSKATAPGVEAVTLELGVTPVLAVGEALGEGDARPAPGAPEPEKASSTAIPPASSRPAAERVGRRAWGTPASLNGRRAQVNRTDRQVCPVPAAVGA